MGANPTRAPAGAPPRQGAWLAAVVAVVALVYLGALAGGFVWDDHLLVEDHPAVVELRSPPDYFLRMFWSNPEYEQSAAFYRPLAILSLALDHALWGPEPLFFHLTNLLAHLGCCALVFLLCLRAGVPAPAAALAAALFGTFPRLSESVAWVSGRTDLLAGLGALAAWLLHRSEPAAWPRRVAAAAALGLGLLAKEVAAAAVAAIAALELWGWREGRQGAARAVRNLAPLALALLAYGALRSAAWLSSGSAVQPDLEAPWSQRPLLVLQALGTYVGMLLDPLRPRLLIGVRGVVEWLWVGVGAASAVVLAWGATRLVRRGSSDAQLAAGALALAALAPVLHLVSIPVVAVAADRFLYLPVAGLTVLLAVGASRLRGPRARAARLAALLALPAFAWASAERAREWSDDLSLFRVAAERAPALNPAGHSGLGEALFRRERYEEAIPPYREAFRRHTAAHARAPWAFGYPENIVTNIGLCMLSLGRHDEAIPILREVAQRNPRLALNRYNLALALAQQLDFAAAERELEAALSLYPEFPRARMLERNLARARERWAALPPPDPDEPTAVRAARARVFARLGHGPAASALWTQVLEAPDAAPADLRGAAVFLVMRGNPDLARRAVERLKAVPSQRGEALRLERALAGRLEAQGGIEPS